MHFGTQTCGVKLLGADNGNKIRNHGTTTLEIHIECSNKIQSLAINVALSFFKQIGMHQVYERVSGLPYIYKSTMRSGSKIGLPVFLKI